MQLSDKSFPEEKIRCRDLGRASTVRASTVRASTVRASTVRASTVRTLAVVALTTSVAGCAGFLPLDAPDAVATHTNAALVTAPSAPLPYALMPINADVLRATNSVTDDTGSAFAKLS